MLLIPTSFVLGILAVIALTVGAWTRHHHFGYTWYVAFSVTMWPVGEADAPTASVTWIASKMFLGLAWMAVFVFLFEAHFVQESLLLMTFVLILELIGVSATLAFVFVWWQAAGVGKPQPRRPIH
ncbi:MAG: hypothetical protein WDZ61_00025 [Parcubacteria group bacterium]